MEVNEDNLLQWDHLADIGSSTGLSGDFSSFRVCSPYKLSTPRGRKKPNPTLIWYKCYKSAIELLVIIVSKVPKNERAEYETKIQNLKRGKGKQHNRLCI